MMTYEDWLAEVEKRDLVILEEGDMVVASEGTGGAAPAIGIYDKVLGAGMFFDNMPDFGEIELEFDDGTKVRGSFS